MVDVSDSRVQGALALLSQANPSGPGKRPRSENSPAAKKRFVVRAIDAPAPPLLPGVD